MMNKLYRRTVGYIMQTKIYRYLLKHVIPYIRFYNLLYESSWKKVSCFISAVASG